MLRYILVFLLGSVLGRYSFVGNYLDRTVLLLFTWYVWIKRYFSNGNGNNYSVSIHSNIRNNQLVYTVDGSMDTFYCSDPLKEVHYSYSDQNTPDIEIVAVVPPVLSDFQVAQLSDTIKKYAGYDGQFHNSILKLSDLMNGPDQLTYLKTVNKVIINVGMIEQIIT